MDETCRLAREQLAGGDAHAAYETVRPLLAYPGDTVTDASALREALAIFVDISDVLAGSAFTDALRPAVQNVDDVEALYGAAYALYEEKQFAIAATLLARADRQAPGQARIVVELAANLEALLRYPDARRVVEAAGIVDDDPFARYLSGFYAIMTGDVDAAQQRLAELGDVTGDLAFMRGELEGMVLRARTLRLGGIDLGTHALTAWHAAINGSLLLHESPYGYDEPMRGRYAFIADSPSLMQEGIERLQRVLGERRMSRVVSAPDRASRILARATATALGLPLVMWESGQAGAGLYVAWDLDAVGDGQFLIDLKVHAPDQILFAHATAWVDPPLYAPDITTLLYQSVTHPYLGGALVVNPTTKATEPSAPDLRDDEVLAAEILASAAETSQTPVALVLDIERALSSLAPAHRPGLDRPSGPRRRLRTGSPVQSARFL